ncbi:MAG: penicillin acylase family protein [Mariniphaga sp.]
MKIFKRVLLVLSLVILIVVIAGYFMLHRIRTSALPDYSENVSLSGLTGEVTILRDSFAIPHIYAQNEADLYRATGYAMAQDRLWQMDLLRRVTQGRLSEVLGKDQLETDLLMRALRIQEKSESILEQIPADVHSALEAFSAGVNHYIENQSLPPEFRILGYEPEPWKPVHSVNLIGYMSWDLTSGWGTEMLLYKLSREASAEQVQALLPLAEVHTTPVYENLTEGYTLGETLLSAGSNLEGLGAQVFYGSNNWAVSGGKSKTGKPLLANDMHLGLFAPGIWYQMHQAAEGTLNVTGLVLPGQPFVICGHNDSIAWGMTNVTVDDIDFYAETFNEDSTKYLLNGQWVDLLIKDERIATKEGEDEIHTLKFTHRGPVVNRFKDEKEFPLSIRWMGNEMSNEIRAVYLLNRAANWNDFRDAVRSFKSVSQNIAYADAAGNIGLQAAAGVPLREGLGIRIYPGDTSLYDWKGMVPFEALPYEYNPARGYVSSANNKTAPAEYPYYVGTWYALPNRIDRIRELLEETPKHGVEDFMQMHGDYKSKKAEQFVPEFLKALIETDDQVQQVALDKLQHWDYRLIRESQAASIFEILYRRVAENLIRDDLPEDLFKSLMGERILVENLMVNLLSDRESSWIDDTATPEAETWSDIVQVAFYETIEELENRLGPDVEDWNWERLHTITISHPMGRVTLLDKAFNLNRGPFGVPGSYHTVTPYSYSYNNLYKVNHGASHRHIYDLSDWNNSKSVIPTGTSGIPASDYYLDQTDMYLENHYHADPFTKDEVEKLTKYEMKLMP